MGVGHTQTQPPTQQQQEAGETENGDEPAEADREEDYRTKEAGGEGASATAAASVAIAVPGANGNRNNAVASSYDAAMEAVEWLVGSFESESPPESAMMLVEPRGLVNNGNTCFMNSTLQSLVACPCVEPLLDRLAKALPVLSPSDTPTLFALGRSVRPFSCPSREGPRHPIPLLPFLSSPRPRLPSPSRLPPLSHCYPPLLPLLSSSCCSSPSQSSSSSCPSRSCASLFLLQALPLSLLLLFLYAIQCASSCASRSSCFQPLFLSPPPPRSFPPFNPCQAVLPPPLSAPAAATRTAARHPKEAPRISRNCPLPLLSRRHPPVMRSLAQELQPPVPTAQEPSRRQANMTAARALNPVCMDPVIGTFCPSFTGAATAEPDQHDAQEFLSFLLDNAHQELQALRKLYAADILSAPPCRPPLPSPATPLPRLPSPPLLSLPLPPLPLPVPFSICCYAPLIPELPSLPFHPLLPFPCHFFPISHLLFLAQSVSPPLVFPPSSLPSPKGFLLLLPKRSFLFPRDHAPNQTPKAVRCQLPNAPHAS